MHLDASVCVSLMQSIMLYNVIPRPLAASDAWENQWCGHTDSLFPGGQQPQAMDTLLTLVRVGNTAPPSDSAAFRHTAQIGHF